MQILTHRTEHTVWQPRWLNHPNGALGLLDLVIAVADLDEAAERFERFTARPAIVNPFGRALRLDRGRVQLMTAQALKQIIELPIPRLPFAAAYGLAATSVAVSEEKLRVGGIATERRGRSVLAKFPEDLGIGCWSFVENAADLSWRAGES
jgi:hypothetical protein